MQELKTLIKKLIDKLDLFYNKNNITKEGKNMTINTTQPINVFDITNYVIEQCQQKQINDLTNMKLQKLLYYIYAKFLVEHKKPLFTTVLEAWPYGPVFRDLYFMLSKYMNNVRR